MDQPLETLVTFILYLGIFAWIGRGRGTTRELIVLGTAILGWILLNTQGGIFVRLVNLGSSFSAVVGTIISGIIWTPELGPNGEAPNLLTEASNAFGSAQAWISPEYQDSFSFVLWVGLILLAYYISNRLPNVFGNTGWAMLVGIANGLFFTSVLLPRLVTILTPQIFNVSSLPDLINTTNIFSLIGGILAALWAGILSIWGIIGGQEFYIIFLILITLLIAFAANTLKEEG